LVMVIKANPLTSSGHVAVAACPSTGSGHAAIAACPSTGSGHAAIAACPSTGSGHAAIAAWKYLILYNLMFLVPLIVVFLLTYFGLKTPTLLVWSKKNVVLSKVLMGAFFITMAVLIIIL